MNSGMTMAHENMERFIKILDVPSVHYATKTKTFRGILQALETDIDKFSAGQIQRLIILFNEELDHDMKHSPFILKAFKNILLLMKDDGYPVHFELAGTAKVLMKYLITTAPLQQARELKVGYFDLLMMLPQQSMAYICQKEADTMYRMVDTFIGNSNIDADMKKSVLLLLQKNYQALPVVDRPNFINNGMSTWFSRLVPFMFVLDNVNNGLTSDVIEEMIPEIVKNKYFNNSHWPVILKNSADCYPAIMMQLLKSGNLVWSKLWQCITKLLRPYLRKAEGPITPLLTVLETAFIADKLSRCEAFKCWTVLMDNFVLETKEIFNMKQIKLIITPLDANNSRTEEISAAKFKTWWHLIDLLQTNIYTSYTKTLLTFMNFCYGDPKNPPRSFVTSSDFPSMHKRLINSYVEIMGHKECSGCVENGFERLHKGIFSVAIFEADHGIWMHYTKQVIIIIGKNLLTSDDMLTEQLYQNMKCIWSSFLAITTNVKDKTLHTTVLKSVMSLLSSLTEECSAIPSLAELLLTVIFPGIVDLKYGYSRSLLNNTTLNIMGGMSPMQSIMVLLFNKNLYQSQLMEKKHFNFECFIEAAFHGGVINFCEWILPRLSGRLHSPQIWCSLSETLIKAERQLNTDIYKTVLLWPINNKVDLSKIVAVSSSWKHLLTCLRSRVASPKIKYDDDILARILEVIEESDNTEAYLTCLYILPIIIWQRFKDSPAGQVKYLKGPLSGLEKILIRLKKSEKSDFNLIGLCGAIECIGSILSSIAEHRTPYAIKPLVDVAKLIADSIMNEGNQPSINVNMSTYICKILRQLNTFLLPLYFSSLAVYATHVCLSFENHKYIPNVNKSAIDVLKELLKESAKNKLDVVNVGKINKALTEKELTSPAANTAGNQVFKTPQSDTATGSPEAKNKYFQIPMKKSSNVEYVVIRPSWKLQASKLTEHQLEGRKRKREDIPALYEDLSQSQDKSISSWTPPGYKSDTVDDSSKSLDGNDLSKKTTDVGKKADVTIKIDDKMSKSSDSKKTVGNDLSMKTTDVGKKADVAKKIDDKMSKSSDSKKTTDIGKKADVTKKIDNKKSKSSDKASKSSKDIVEKISPSITAMKDSNFPQTSLSVKKKVLDKTKMTSDENSHSENVDIVEGASVITPKKLVGSFRSRLNKNFLKLRGSPIETGISPNSNPIKTNNKEKTVTPDPLMTPVNKEKHIISSNTGPTDIMADRPSRIKRKPNKFYPDDDCFEIKKRRASVGVIDSAMCEVIDSEKAQKIEAEKPKDDVQPILKSVHDVDLITNKPVVEAVEESEAKEDVLTMKNKRRSRLEKQLAINTVEGNPVMNSVIETNSQRLMRKRRRNSVDSTKSPTDESNKKQSNKLTNKLNCKKKPTVMLTKLNKCMKPSQDSPNKSETVEDVTEKSETVPVASSPNTEVIKENICDDSIVKDFTNPPDAVHTVEIVGLSVKHDDVPIQPDVSSDIFSDSDVQPNKSIIENEKVPIIDSSVKNLHIADLPAEVPVKNLSGNLSEIECSEDVIQSSQDSDTSLTFTKAQRRISTIISNNKYKTPSPGPPKVVVVPVVDKFYTLRQDTRVENKKSKFEDDDIEMVEHEIVSNEKSAKNIEIVNKEFNSKNDEIQTIEDEIISYDKSRQFSEDAELKKLNVSLPEEDIFSLKDDQIIEIQSDYIEIIDDSKKDAVDRIEDALIGSKLYELEKLDVIENIVSLDAEKDTQNSCILMKDISEIDLELIQKATTIPEVDNIEEILMDNGEKPIEQIISEMDTEPVNSINDDGDDCFIVEQPGEQTDSEYSQQIAEADTQPVVMEKSNVTATATTIDLDDEITTGDKHDDVTTVEDEITPLEDKQDEVTAVDDEISIVEDEITAVEDKQDDVTGVDDDISIVEDEISTIEDKQDKATPVDDEISIVEDDIIAVDDKEDKITTVVETHRKMTVVTETQPDMTVVEETQEEITTTGETQEETVTQEKIQSETTRLEIQNDITAVEEVLDLTNEGDVDKTTNTTVESKLVLQFDTSLTKDADDTIEPVSETTRLKIQNDVTAVEEVLDLTNEDDVDKATSTTVESKLVLQFDTSLTEDADDSIEPVNTSDECVKESNGRQLTTSILSSPCREDIEERNTDFLNSTLDISPIKGVISLTETNDDCEEAKSLSSPDKAENSIADVPTEVSPPKASCSNAAVISPDNIFLSENISPEKIDVSPPRSASLLSSPSSMLAQKKNRTSYSRAAQMLGLCNVDLDSVRQCINKPNENGKKESSPVGTPVRKNLHNFYGNGAETNGESNGEEKSVLGFNKMLPSPFASPAGPILKINQPKEDHTVSPSSRRKRVSFHDPPVSTSINVEKYIEGPNITRSPQSTKNYRDEFSFMKSPKRMVVKCLAKKMETESYKESNKKDGQLNNADKELNCDSQMSDVCSLVIESPQELEITSNHLLVDDSPIYPSLCKCEAPISEIALKLSSPMWKDFFLKDLLTEVSTIGDLASMTELQVNRLPIKSPKIATVKKVLAEYESEHPQENQLTVDTVLDEEMPIESAVEVNEDVHCVGDPEKLADALIDSNKCLASVMYEHLKNKTEEEISADLKTSFCAQDGSSGSGDNIPSEFGVSTIKSLVTACADKVLDAVVSEIPTSLILAKFSASCLLQHVRGLIEADESLLTEATEALQPALEANIRKRVASENEEKFSQIKKLCDELNGKISKL